MRPVQLLCLMSGTLSLLALSTAPVHASDWRIELSGTRYALGQANHPSQSTAEVPISQASLVDAGSRYRTETRTQFPGDLIFQILEIGGPEGSQTVDRLGWRTGSEIIAQGAERGRNAYADLLLLSPALLLERARDPGALQADGSRAVTDSAGRAVQLRYDAAGDIVEARVGPLQYTYQSHVSVGPYRQPVS